MIGWEDIVKGRNYTTTVKCYSKTGRVLKLRAKDFINEVKKDRETVKMILNISGERDSLTIKQIRQAKSILNDNIRKTSHEIETEDGDVLSPKQQAFRQRKQSQPPPPQSNETLISNMLVRNNMRPDECKIADVRSVMQDIVQN